MDNKVQEMLEDMVRVLGELYKKKECETDIEKIHIIESDIDNIQCSIYEFLKDSDRKHKLINNFINLKKLYERIDFLLPIYNDFCKIAAPSNIRMPKPQKIYFSDEEILDINEEFFNSIGGILTEYYNHFLTADSFLLSRPVTKKIKFVGEVIYLKSLDTSFITINIEKNIEDVISFAHEVMHSIALRQNNLGDEYPYNLYRELPTLFIELVFINYLYKSKYSKDSQIIEASTLKDMFFNAYDIKSIKKILDAINTKDVNFKNDSEFKSFCQNNCNFSSRTLEDAISYSDTNPEIYLISYIFALELYYIYLQDKNEAFHLLDVIMKITARSEREYFDKLQNLGLNPNEHLPEYTKATREKIAKLVRKR